MALHQYYSPLVFLIRLLVQVVQQLESHVCEHGCTKVNHDPRPERIQWQERVWDWMSILARDEVKTGKDDLHRLL